MFWFWLFHETSYYQEINYATFNITCSGSLSSSSWPHLRAVELLMGWQVVLGMKVKWCFRLCTSIDPMERYGKGAEGDNTNLAELLTFILDLDKYLSRSRKKSFSVIQPAWSATPQKWPKFGISPGKRPVPRKRIFLGGGWKGESCSPGVTVICPVDRS